MVFPSGFPGGTYDLGRDDGRVGLCDLPLFELARNDGADLIAKAEGGLGDNIRGNGGLDYVLSIRRENCTLR